MLQVNEKPTFIIDAMLGNISKKLRLFGFDSEYYSDIDDEDLIKKAINENRILVTKDLPLYEKARKLKTMAIFLKNDNEFEQLIQIFKELKFSTVSISGNNTRCTDCNSILETIEKGKIIDKIPEKIFERNSNFWKCSNCNKIYWEGTHILRLQKLVDDLNERL